MRWTTQRPTKPGLWFYKGSGWGSLDSKKILHVYNADDGLRAYPCDHTERSSVKISYMSGEWSDTPIAEPGDV